MKSVSSTDTGTGRKTGTGRALKRALRGMRNTYRRDRSYLWNYRHGPSYPGPFPRLERAALKDFLGFRVRSRLGIAAGILLNSRWIECYSRLGYDILTYKTVRSAARPCYPLPNWVYVEAPPQGVLGADPRTPLRVVRRAPRDPARATSSVCFGMPSMAPEDWRRDVSRAKRCLRRGQVLMVSVVGTPRDGGTFADLVEDFARCARWAAGAGADVVEANYSCPNVTTSEGSLYEDARRSGELSRTLRDALPSTPFLIKAGHFETGPGLRAFFEAVKDHADGVVIVNGVARRVHGPDGRPVFPGHEVAGIIGRAVHGPALDNVRRAVLLTRRNGWKIETLAVGGVLSVSEAERFFEAGAAAVLIGGGAALMPGLAAEIKSAHPEW